MHATKGYVPRNLSVSFRPGVGIYEFLFVWQHEIGSLPKILDVFSRHRAKVLMTHSQLDEESGVAVGTCYCDLSKADLKVEGLRTQIKALGFVQSAEYVSTQSALFDKFLFPVTIWGRNRVLIMRLSPLLNIENKLTQELGSAGGAIMFREGEGYAMETLAQYRAVLGKVSTETLIETVKDGLRATGWGIFDFKLTTRGYDATVLDAPLLDGAKEPSRFLCGVIAAIVESVFATKVKIAESTADSKTGSVLVRLEREADGSGS